MTTTIEVQMTPQGLLIPRAALGDWRMEELEAVREEQGIVIRPKLTETETRSQVRQILDIAGLLYQPNWETPQPVSSEERAQLAKKLAQGQPLSEIIIAEHEDCA
jgi:hypothetical protein